MSIHLIIELVLIALCTTLIIREIIHGDKAKANNKQNEYTLTLNGKSCTIRLTKKEARAVKSCVSQYTFEHGDSGLSFTETKILD